MAAVEEGDGVDPGEVVVHEAEEVVVFDLERS